MSKSSTVVADYATSKTQTLWVLTPLFGTLLFSCFYLVATHYYPGGSQADITSKGFSWLNNYWCNLLNQNAMNGQLNPARPIALTGMFTLCVTLSVFWYIFPRQVRFTRSSRVVFQLSGLFAMSIAMFLFTSMHDTIITVASSFGLVACIGTFIGLYRLNWMALFWLGNVVLGLVLINNLLYYGPGLRYYLPLIQKVTFIIFLIWISLIDIKIYKYKIDRLAAEQ